MEYQVKTELAKYGSKNPLIKFVVSQFQKDLLNVLRNIPSPKILDAGCGLGKLMSLVRKIKPDSEITGIDILDECINIAKSENPSSTFKKANIYSIPFQEDFDLVIACEVIEHLESPEKALSELKRVTKKYCVVSVPNEPYFSIANLLRLKYLKTWGNYPGHLHKFSQKKFRKLLKNYFSKVTIKNSTIWQIALCEV